MMSRKVRVEAPSFARTSVSVVQLSYDIELITPMAGGGVESWKPDKNNPARSQAIKGQLRFWWRTMQHAGSPQELKDKEDRIWGSTDQAATVTISIDTDAISNLQFQRIERTGGNNQDVIEFNQYHLPGYVLFPLQGQKDNHGNLIQNFDLINSLDFRLIIHCQPYDKQDVENTVKLWVLFGGLGARSTRGCGSLYCKKIMDSFTSCDNMHQFIRDISPEDTNAFGKSPYPVLNNCRFAYSLNSNQKNPAAEWNSFLSNYGIFRQGPGVGREPGYGRTRWPEADAIRRIDGTFITTHTPAHPAGNWFPRGAYGLPLKTEFKDEPPNGIFLLQPADKGRWPSPVILKVIKLDEQKTARICLILNHLLPPELVINKNNSYLHTLLPDEHPLASSGKIMPTNATMMHSGAPGCMAKDPYDALIEHLNLTEVP